jgi:hypothetical protein
LTIIAFKVHFRNSFPSLASQVGNGNFVPNPHLSPIWDPSTPEFTFRVGIDSESAESNENVSSSVIRLTTSSQGIINSNGGGNSLLADVISSLARRSSDSMMSTKVSETDYAAIIKNGFA